MPTFKIPAAIAAATVVLTGAAHAQTAPGDMPAGVYQIDPAHSSVTWRVNHIGLSKYTARFTDVDARLGYDPEAPENSSLIVTIDPKSVDTDFPFPDQVDFDQEIAMGEGWLNAGEHPEIKFVATGVERTGETTGTMTGDLTLLGVTKPVTLDVTFNGAYEKQPFNQKPALGFSAKGTVQRSAFGMDTYVPNIGDEVELLIEAEFNQG